MLGAPEWGVGELMGGARDRKYFVCHDGGARAYTMAAGGVKTSFNRRHWRFETYPCAPRPPQGLWCCHRPHLAPRGYQESDPWRVRTVREGHSATSPPNVVGLRGGPAESTGCSLGLGSDPARINGGRWRMCVLWQGGDKKGGV